MEVCQAPNNVPSVLPMLKPTRAVRRQGLNIVAGQRTGLKPCPILARSNPHATSKQRALLLWTAPVCAKDC